MGLRNPSLDDWIWQLTTDHVTGHWVHCVGTSGAPTEIGRLRAKLEQIAAVCRDNAAPTCRHDMALDFVRQIAERNT